MNRNTGKIIAWIVIILVIVAVVGVVAKFTDGFTSNFKTFYVTIDGEDVMNTASDYTVSPDNPMKVEVKQIFTAGGKEKGYTVKVVPNLINGKDFDFTVNGEPYSYHAEKDISKGFDIKLEEDFFTIAPKGLNTQEVLQAVYPDGIVGGGEDAGYENMYSMYITSADGKSRVRINFSVASPITDIKLDPEAAVF